jgi:prevent-host-death family protein
MGSHSVADAKNRLSELIDRALKGEGVVITRHGHPVVELKPVAQPVRRMTADDIEKLVTRARSRGKSQIDAGKLLREMRDEDWH